MSAYTTPSRRPGTRAYKTSSPAQYGVNVHSKAKFDAHLDENANDHFHEENVHHTPNRLHVKNADGTNERVPRTPKPSFEEEQQELKKSLSKDWCDRMDNEEVEEKKLHSFVLYLQKFPVHENKTTEELLACIECSPKELLRRQKEISKGKLSNAYENYLSMIPRKSRSRQHPRTPCKYAKMSRRGFDGAIKAWRRKLHEFNGDRTKENQSPHADDSISSSQRSDGYSTPSSTSMSIEDIDDSFLPDLYDFEEALTNEGKFEPFVEVDVTDSMDTIMNNVDSRSAMAFD